MTVQVIFILLLIQLRSFALGIQCKESKEDFNVYYKEKWNVNLDLFDDTPRILQVWPIPNTNEVNFYGKYRELTIVGNKDHVSLYELYPSDDSHVWYKDGLYFIASNMLCKYGYSEEVGKIECSKFEGGTNRKVWKENIILPYYVFSILSMIKIYFY